LKKNLILILPVFLASCIYIEAATKISASASPLRVTAGEEVQITVFCVDTATNALQKGVLVKFSVAAGGGKVMPASATSGEDGKVKAKLITGSKSGTNAVKVEGAGLNTVFVSVNSEALPPAGFTVKVEPDKIYSNQTASLLVIVKNAKGELFKDAEVRINPSALVTAAPALAKTDSSGAVKAVLKAGKQTGVARIEVMVLGLDAKNVDFEVMLPAAKNIETSAGSLNIGTRNKTTLTARVIDTSNEPMSRVPVNFQIDSGDAALSVNQAITDAKGVCSVELTAGNSAGVVVVKIGNNDFKAVDLRINVSAVIMPPAFLSARANETGIFVGEETTLTAVVEDKDRRLINGAAVNFERISGGGSLLSPSGKTDGGKASTIFTAGLVPGKTVIKVSSGTLPPVMLTITCEAATGQSVEEKSGKAAKIFLSAGNMYPAFMSKQSVTALITDASNLPVSGAEVKFSSQGNAVSDAAVKTDSNGEAGTLVSYTGLGKLTVKAQSKGQSGSLELNYKMPEWVYLLPVFILFLSVIFFYFLKAGSLKRKLLSSSTGLNSDLFVKHRIGELLARKKSFAACFIDIDDFKIYNTAAGFARGDEVIIAVAALLRKNVPPTGIAAHFGGDDFVYICEPERAREIAGKITDEFDAILLSFYSKEDYKNGYSTVKNSDGMLFNYPLMKLSIAIAEPEKAAAKTYNELFEFAGKLLKSAKAKKKEKIVGDCDDEAERGAKKVRVGWFATGVFILALLLPGFFNAETDTSKKLKLSAVPESAGTGQTVRLIARLTDNKDRPISGAFLLFEDLNKGAGTAGGFSKAGARTGKDGNAETFYTAGEKTGKALVQVSFKGEVFSTAFVGVQANYLWYVFIPAVFVLSGFMIFYILKLLKLEFLFRGIDPETGLRTRVSAENKMRALFTANEKFHAIFIDFRNFAGFNREFGYAEGKKAAKIMGEQIKSIIKEFAPVDGEVFFYGEDKFAVVTKQAGEEIAKNIMEEMEIHIPLICRDKNASYYLLHTSVALVFADLVGVKTLGEIMQIAGALNSEAKTRSGSTLLKG